MSSSSAPASLPDQEQISASAPVVAGPTTIGERVTSIDVLRGVAVLGILVMNIQSFSMIDAAYLNPTSYGDLTGINFAVWLVSHLFFDQKFMTIFSMLFGAGIVLMGDRRAHAGLPAAGVHYRRMFVLMLFGIAHAYLIWFGDILYTYALCGMIAYWFRRLRPGTLLGIGFVLLLIPSLMNVLAQRSMPQWPEEQRLAMEGSWAPSAQQITENLATYRGSWTTQLPRRTNTAFWFQTFLFGVEFVWRVTGLMLIGMALYRRGVFSARASTRAYVVMVVIGLALGVPFVLLGVRQNFAHQWDMGYSFFTGIQFNYWASIAVSIGWIGGIMLWCKRGALGSVARTFAAVGRMAFTNYLAQSVIATTLFYGHGFGLFGRLERWQQALVVIAIWIVQLVWSRAWLSRFRMGPMEWLWRTLTYWSPQKLTSSAQP